MTVYLNIETDGVLVSLDYSVTAVAVTNYHDCVTCLVLAGVSNVTSLALRC